MCRCLTDGYAACSVLVVVGCVGESFLHLVFCDERLDDAQTAKCLFKLRHNLAPFSLRFERLSLEFLSDCAHTPGHKRNHSHSEQCKLPAGRDKSSEIEEDEDRVLDEHIKRTCDRVFDLVHVAAHSCDDVSLFLLREESDRKTEKLVVYLCSDVSYDTGPERNHNRGRTEVAGCLERCHRYHKQTDDHKGLRSSPSLHRKGGIVVHIVHHQVFDRYAAVPRNKFISRSVQTEENLEKRDDQGE